MSQPEFGRIAFFGDEEWLAERNGRRCEVPVDEECTLCRRPIQPGDNGIAMPNFDVPGSSLGYMHGCCFTRVVTRALPPGFTCPLCLRTSYHPKDLAEGYCSRCHDWTRPLAPPPGWATR